MALTTVARARLAMPNVTVSVLSDTDLAIILDAASAMFERLTHRIFAQADYSERYDGGDNQHLLLRQYPIISINRVAVCRSEAIRIWNSDRDTNQRAAVSVTSTGLTLKRMASGVASSSSLAFATYVTIASLADAINLLGNGWAAQVQGDFGKYPTAWLYYQQGAMNARDGGGASLLMFDEEISEYEIDAAAGILSLVNGEGWTCGANSVLVDSTAGYATIPDDIQEAVASMTATLWSQGSRDPELRREKLGDYEWERFEGANASKMFSASAMAVISSYTDRR